MGSPTTAASSSSRNTASVHSAIAVSASSRVSGGGRPSVERMRPSAVYP